MYFTVTVTFVCFSVTMAVRGEEHALIVDGQTLTFALTDHRPVFLQLCHRCVAVLCCRMSPIQKAQVCVMQRLTDWLLLFVIDWSLLIVLYLSWATYTRE